MNIMYKDCSERAGFSSYLMEWNPKGNTEPAQLEESCEGIMHHLAWKGQMTMLMMMTLLGRCSDITCTFKIPSWQKVLSILFAFFFF